MEPSAQLSVTGDRGDRSGGVLFPLPRKGNPPTLREQRGAALVLAGIAHDSRNLVTALGLCAESISEPGVLAPSHRHFAVEIRSLAAASARLMQRLSDFAQTAAVTKVQATVRATAQATTQATITDLAAAVGPLSSLLKAIAGPGIEVQVACLPCSGELQLTEEDLSRILVNLVRNAADAMPTGGRIRITAQRGGGGGFLWTAGEECDGEQSAQYLWDDAPHPADSAPQTVCLTVEDNGPGIAEEHMDRIFEPGFTTRAAGRSWPEAQHRGLGLSIVRQLVEAAGGSVRVKAAPIQGARFEVELPLTVDMPLTNVTPTLPSERAFNSESDAE